MWEDAYAALRPIVFRTAYRLTGGDVDAAQDLTQEAFLNFLRYANLKTLQSDDHLLAYLRQTVRHLCSKRLRERASTVSIDSIDGKIAQEMTEDGDVGIQELAADIEQLTERLSQIDRRLLIALISGAHLPEIAEDLAITYGAAGVRVHRLRDKLRHIINGL